jgi:predicted CXXCH cytochrome family protein
MSRNNKTLWVVWLASTIIMGAYFGYRLLGEDKYVFLPGDTTHGHYQIEMACTACHAEAFGGEQTLQEACMNCHGTELKTANDSHPRSKFTDPRNANRLEKLDARKCVTCHVEHQPEITSVMAVTVPNDVCRHCHLDIAVDRPSHAGMEFETCASAGCHNFHDNRGLYEDFLLKHLHEADILSQPQVVTRNLRASLELLNDYPFVQYPVRRLSLEERDAPSKYRQDAIINRQWYDTAHAQAGVNCSACHASQSSGKPVWIEKPNHAVCTTCHQEEVKGFMAGKHGMRLAQQLSPMTPAQARQPMRSKAHDKKLTCITCHTSHEFNTYSAAVEACLGCHDDRHSQAYKTSPHYNLLLTEQNNEKKISRGVSCATCHMPRIPQQHGDQTRVLVQHNQNENLRPNEKMLRSVCMQCHGLKFSIDALADNGLVQSNFTGKPSIHIESIDMAERRSLEKTSAAGEGG